MHNIVDSRFLVKMLTLALVITVVAQGMTVFADDCDHWGRLVHTGGQPGDTYCLAFSGNGGAVSKQLEDKFDFDYFVLYLGYDDETAIHEVYKVELTNTSLTRPKIVVGTFYDNAPAWSGQSGTEVWYNAYSGRLGGISLEEFQQRVTLGPNLKHDAQYELVNGQVVLVNEGSAAAIRQEFSAVPVGTNLATNERGETFVYFTPPDKGAYIVMISNYSPTRTRGKLTGSYTLNISRD